MKIYIINLRKDIEKKNRIKNRLDFLKIKYEFFDAIDGKQISHKGIYTGWCDTYNNRYVTKGEVGCSLSHYYIWEKIINENIEKAIILEDDVEILDKHFIEKVNNVTEFYDLLYLSRKKITGEVEKSINEEINICSTSYWLCAYCITIECARKIKNDIFYNNIIPVDEYLPYLYSNMYNKHLDNIYSNIPKIKSLTFKNNLLKPEVNAFQKSTTFFSEPCEIYREDIILVTVASDMNDCLKRYISSCKKFGFNPIVLGLGKPWNGGDMEKGPGGGQKIILLQDYLKKQTENKLIVFTDSYDVICNNNINNLINNYKKFYDNKIVFASENSCWPDKDLENLYPNVNKSNKYLNSGLFIGYINDIKNIIKKEIKPYEDDQLYYTYEFLCNQDDIKLDYDNKLFLCLNCSENEYNINKSKSLLYYKHNIPTFLHGNGPPKIKRRLNYVSNYLCNNYNSTYGYKNINRLQNYQPDITIIFEETNIPCKIVIEGICNLKYPRDKVNFIYLYNKIPELEIIKGYKNIICDYKNQEYLLNNIKKIESKNIYLENNEIEKLNTIILRERKDTHEILKITDKIKGAKVFYINSHCKLTNNNVIQYLLNENKSFIGPLLRNPNSLYSNFWGDLDNNNYYKRSHNYIDILENKETSCWNVPYVGYCFFINKELFSIKNLISNLDKGEGYDMALCYNIRKSNIFINILNTDIFGFYTDEIGIRQNNISLNDYNSNKLLWEKKYLDSSFNTNIIMKEIGNNISKVKIFSETFCEEIIKLTNNKGWSKGGESYFDKRLGGKESHPTQDIHLNEIELQDMWKWIVDNYISKLVWNKYKYSTKNINISFVVKYDMEGQKSLRNHHDSSTYTINICLNKDFEGGGCHFIKDDLKIINKDIGTMILHPGKLTHYHSGLPITSGKRFILVSFIN